VRPTNVNDPVRVRLTLEGLKALARAGGWDRKFSVAGTVWQGPLWELCAIFGPFMYNGAEPVFTKNEVIFVPPSVCADHGGHCGLHNVGCPMCADAKARAEAAQPPPL